MDLLSHPIAAVELVAQKEIEDKTLLEIALTLAQHEASSLLWSKNPQIFSWHNIVRFYQKTSVDKLRGLAKRDERLNRLILLRLGQAKLREPVEGLIVADVLLEQGCFRESLDCIRDCLESDVQLWELFIRLAHFVRTFESTDTVRHRRLIDDWIGMHPLSGFPEWREAEVLEIPMRLETLDLVWDRCYPNRFISHWILGAFREKFKGRYWRNVTQSICFTSKLIKMHKS